MAAAVTAVILSALAISPTARFGWFGEPAVWVYVGVLWAGGLKVWLGTMRPIVEADDTRLVLRPLHNLRQRSILWDSIRGTEQMTGGDRLIVYYDTPRGMRFAALNLNLVKGRREFLSMVEERLRASGAVETIVDRSRFLTVR